MNRNWAKNDPARLRTVRACNHNHVYANTVRAQNGCYSYCQEMQRARV